MKYKKTIILLVLTIFIFGVASVCASDVNDTVIASEDTSQMGLSVGSEMDMDNLKTSEGNTTLTQTNNDESVSEEIDSEVLGADTGTYSGLSEEIGSGGNIELEHDYYNYDPGSTIEITVDNSVIDGKGAVIDMKESTNMRAFYVNAFGVTIKNLTIKNVKFEGIGGAIFFNVLIDTLGTVTNCNFINNTATRGEGGAIFMRDGLVENCNFVNNSNKMAGAISIAYGSIENCNFTNNKAVGEDAFGGAIFLNSKGSVTNCYLE